MGMAIMACLYHLDLREMWPTWRTSQNKIVFPGVPGLFRPKGDHGPDGGPPGPTGQTGNSDSSGNLNNHISS